MFVRFAPSICVSLVALLLAAPRSFAISVDPVADFRQLLDDAWQYDLIEDPLFATFTGDNRYNDRLPRVRPEDIDRRAGFQRELLDRLATIDRAALPPAERINYDIFSLNGEDSLSEHEFGSHLMPITNRSGFHIDFPELPKQAPLNTVEDYENYIARLKAFGVYVDDHIELMKAGIERGWVLPAVALRNFDEAIRPHIVEDPTSSLLYEPFAKFPDRIAESDRERLAASGSEAIRDSIVPGYRRFGDFLRDEYEPKARGQVGASALPNGRDFYRHRVRRFTTLDLTPEEVHETGQREVRRILDEMNAVIKKSGFEGDRAAFVEYLRTDPKFYAETPEELMEAVSLALKKMDGELPRLFKTLPRMPYGIRPIPDYIAPKTTTAYYQPPAGDGTRAGFYYVNTYNLKSRPLYEVEALSLHEAVPGHHLQIALQQELEGLPPMRRFSQFTAFIEGWGLYSERLGLEVGFYQDPYTDFGRLSYEMWRACRLVVDTGMHYLGWTRAQAIDFMAQNTALSLHNIEAEVDRYIAWPGQAVAYKIGELKIRELRAFAERELRERFDVREFHEVVLGNGSIPLSVLEENVKAYVAR